MPDGVRSEDPWTIHQAKRRVFLVPLEGTKTIGDAVAERRLAARLLADARTTRELARLVGDLPSRCVPGKSQEQCCVWLVTARAEGGQRIAAVIGSKKLPVRLTCRLPLDGTPRRGESCRVSRE